MAQGTHQANGSSRLDAAANSGPAMTDSAEDRAATRDADSGKPSLWKRIGYYFGWGFHGGGTV